LIFTVLCTDVCDYIDWQCDLLEYTWNRAGQSGELLRLVTCPAGTRLPRHQHATVVRVEPQPERYRGYKPMERFFALEQWLHRERPQGTVLFLDPDVVFRRAIRGEAEPGAPRAQLWVDYSPASSQTQAATWPMLIHTRDLEQLLPQWIALTAAIHTATHRWESEMYALVAAAASTRLTFSLEAIGAFVGWPDEQVGEAPLVHYCQDVVDRNGTLLWSKRVYQPWNRIAGADRARHGYCRDLLALLDEYAAVRTGAGSSTGPSLI
jgi:hypothetical protein